MSANIWQPYKSSQMFEVKNPNNMRGKAKPQPYYAPKRKKRR